MANSQNTKVASKWWVLAIFVGLLFSIGRARAGEILKMDSQVRDLLQKRCAQCHGENGANQGKLGSILDFKNILAKGIVVPGKAEDSQLLQLVELGQMPPQKKLVDGEIQLLRDWIQNLPVAATTKAPHLRVRNDLPEVFPARTLVPRSKRNSVLQHHGDLTRDGNYVVPAFGRSGLASFRFDQQLNAQIQGAVYAQPLYVEKGSGERDVLIVVTEENRVYGINGQSGELIWSRSLRPPVKQNDLPCGNIDPLGVTGTPVVDSASNTFYFDAMETPDSGATKIHMIYRMSVADGSVLDGWPIDVADSLKKIGEDFHAEVQNQRGALALVTDAITKQTRLYIPYGGHWGDCGDYHGWVVTVDSKNSSAVRAWHVGATAGGIWAPGGVSSSDDHIYVATGNTEDAKIWAGGEALLKLPLDLSFQPKSSNYFTPSNWRQLDEADADVGGVAPVLIDVPDDAHSKLAVGFGKDGFIYVIDRNNLGGLGRALKVQHVATSPIISAAASYTTSTGTYVVVKARGNNCPDRQTGDLTAFRITTKPNLKVTTAWCAAQNGTGSPIVTTTDGHQNPVVWSLGAEGDQLLHGFDGETGKPLTSPQPLPKMPGIMRFQSAIVTGLGRLFVVGDGKVYVYTVDGSRLPASLSKKSTSLKLETH